MPVQTQGERAAPLVAMHPAQVFARSELLQIKVPLPQGYLAQHDPVRVLRFGDFPAAPGADPGSQSIPPGTGVLYMVHGTSRPSFHTGFIPLLYSIETQGATTLGSFVGPVHGRAG